MERPSVKRKTSTAAFLMIILVCIPLAIRNVKKVWADGTIYIRSDGSVDPPGAPIQRDGDVYTFKASIYETIVVQRDNAVIDGNGYTLQGAGSGTGFDLSGRNNVTIKKTNIAEWNYGIHIYNLSSGNTIMNNNLTQNYWRAIFTSNSSNNIIRDNIISNNDREGIFLWLTNTTTITRNNVSNNGEDGIAVGYLCFNNTIKNNTLADNAWAGISLGYEVKVPTNNTIIGNNITNNVWAGIYIDHQSGNTFYHNNLYNNTKQVFTVGAANTWDNGYLIGGNYWSNYTGQDLDGDGIGDTPHVIDANNTDNYPFMHPWTLHAYDVATVNVTPFKTVVGQGFSLSINVTVANQGSYTQTFNVTTYVNSTVIETETVTLDSENSATLIFTWNTTGFAKGSYNISAYAAQVPGEVDLSDNLEDETVIVSISGDINGDKIVNAFDFQALGKAYGSALGGSDWNPNADLNSDEIVDSLDLEIFAQNYGKLWF